MNKLRMLTLALILLGTLNISGCNNIWVKDELTKHSLEDFPKADSNSDQDPTTNQHSVQETSTTESQSFNNSLTNRASEIEVVWRVPEVKVTSYIINYGYSRSSLNQSKEVPITDLEQFEDGINGQVYRYIFKDTDPTKPFFISIIANDNGQRSEASEIMEVVAE